MAVVKFKAKAKRAIARTLRNGFLEFGPKAADNMSRRIEYCAELLALNPYMGKVEPELAGKEYEYRSFVVHEHFISFGHRTGNHLRSSFLGRTPGTPNAERRNKITTKITNPKIAYVE